MKTTTPTTTVAGLTLCGLVDVLVLQDPGQAKVGHLDVVMLPHQDVGRPEVTVQKVLHLQVLHPVRNLPPPNKHRRGSETVWGTRSMHPCMQLLLVVIKGLYYSPRQLHRVTSGLSQVHYLLIY